ncbi:MAG: gliding motility-associated C-terminal domain-containing protein [Flavobacteriales bacterium]|nr:gliding motility-associated C-terminal domain-containing protein [Flavobacteriales bacterium]
MRKILLNILIFFLPLSIFATHNRAGEITFKHISGFTYEITVITYVKESSPADRPELEIYWGDGTPLDTINRISEISLGSDIKKNTYSENHTYPGASPIPYTIRIEDPNRNAGIINIPNSVNVIFYLETMLIINPFVGINNSPVLLNPPIDNACVGKTYIHNPGAWDIDGDSLYYTISESKQNGGNSIPGYTFPQASNYITVNPITGDLVWETPIAIGEYNVSIRIDEYRMGVKIGSILRDMQITVTSCSNNPPIISGPTDTCVVVGDTLNLNYNALDIDGNTVTFTVTGGPMFSSTNPANFSTSGASSNVNGIFSWIPGCLNIRSGDYILSLKAIDNGSPNLVDFHTLFINVLAPAPKNPVTTVLSNAIELKWDKTPCNHAIKYKIYRKQGPSGWNPNYCETGIPTYTGFQFIGETNSINDTVYVDSNQGLGLNSGVTYCYRIIAFYPDGTESKASEEVCGQLIKDVPIITHTSVLNTSTTNGKIFIDWSKPTEFDSVLYPGPYRYLIYRGIGTSTSLLLIDSTASINDTSYTDSLLDTKNYQMYYRVDLYNLTSGTRDLIGKSTVASSVFLNLIPSDNQITLQWNESVPWTNTEHVIFKQNPITLQFDSITTTTNNLFVDTALVNGTTYCYQVKSIGSYSTPNLISPIINFSQENCAVPIDNVKPCSPILSIEAVCDTQLNKLSWTNPTVGCDNDIMGYNLYKSDTVNEEYYLVATITNASDTFYIHEKQKYIAGCYVIAAFDSVGNESAYSDSVCVDNCPEYSLPNVFTPGNDGYNDFFRPFPYRYVESIEIKIFNRWGNLVFESNDPEIMWNGKNQKSGVMCSDGVYFYVCTVEEKYIDGKKPKVIKGFITLLRNK